MGRDGTGWDGIGRDRTGGGTGSLAAIREDESKVPPPIDCRHRGRIRIAPSPFQVVSLVAWFR